jgi:hypothetical protein
MDQGLNNMSICEIFLNVQGHQVLVIGHLGLSMRGFGDGSRFERDARCSYERTHYWNRHVLRDGSKSDRNAYMSIYMGWIKV